MSKKQNTKQQEAVLQENMNKRVENLFSKQDTPSYLSIRQTEEMKARLDQLESRLAEQQIEPIEPQPAEQQVEPVEGNPVGNQESPVLDSLPKTPGALKLSRKILFPVLIIFSLVFLGFSIFSYLTTNADFKAQEAKDSQLAEEFFQSKIQNITDFANGLAIQTATNPEIQAAFAARDRETLQSITYETFQALEEEYQIRQFQFHLSPATSFLRLHSLGKFGDDLSTFRFTVLEVNATQRPIAGLEVGRGGAGIRGVQPVFYEERHIGSVEFGLNFDETLVNSLKEEFGNDWRIILTRESLSLATLEDLSLFKDGPTPDTLVLASTLEETYPDAATYAKVLGGERLITQVSSGDRIYSVTSLPLRDYSGKIIGVVDVLLDRTAVIQSQNNRLTFMILGIIVAMIVGAYSLTTITNRSLQPLKELTRAAEAMEKGDLNQQVKIFSRDEIGQLGQVFNQTISQLRNMFTTLEQRVAERTHDLELASEVGRTVSGRVANLYEMLAEAAELIRSRFDLYYTQIYLADTSERNLKLSAGTGTAGAELLRRGHRLAINQASINGRAAIEKRPVVVADASQSANFLPNPLLPDTRSEMAIPLVAGGKLVGVLDVQSNHAGALNETNLTAFEALAGQLAVAVQNATLFNQAETARTEVEQQSRRLTREGWQNFLDAVERSEKLGFVFNQNEILPATGILPADHANSLTSAIKVTGAEIGEISLLDEPNRVWTAAESRIVETTAVQLGQHIENLRLLGQAEKYRHEAEEFTRRLTREGWESFTREANSLANGYEYNLEKVEPIRAGNGSKPTALNKPILVRDEKIGELAVNVDATQVPEDANELVAAVAEQLSTHIETLRLAEELQERAAELETVAALSSTTSTLLDPDKLLQTVVDLTKERFNLYHTHIYLADESWQTLLLAAGAGDIGRQMVADNWNIPMDHALSMVASAARNREYVIANNISREKHTGFLSNYLLPDTRSEMAVPMIVGDKLLGVFDVQADTANYFSDEDANIFTTLASQVAVALQNARLYVQQAATVTQLRELDRLKSSFLANMSHELRTPLNSILGFADVMLEELDGPLTENMNTDLKLIQKNGLHLLHLINDVLDMAKIEAGRMNLNPEKFRVQEMFEEVLSITSTLASEKNIALFIEEDSDPQAFITADRTRIRQVLINLVNNAMKFTERGKISIHARRTDENVLICVHDTGIGIPPDKLEAVFQEFIQVDTSTTRKAGGTGLGLPISRKLIEMHGGRLWAESTGIPGEGSNFYAELPIEAVIPELVEVEKVQR